MIEPYWQRMNKEKTQLKHTTSTQQCPERATMFPVTVFERNHKANRCGRRGASLMRDSISVPGISVRETSDFSFFFHFCF